MNRGAASISILIAIVALGGSIVATTSTNQESTPDEKAIIARGGRLQDISVLIQDPKNDTEALATEAMRLCGFVIWTEQRKPVAEPLGAPRLGLAITNTELNAYSTMFRNGMRIKFSDLVSMFDYLLQKCGVEESCGPRMLEAITYGNVTDNASQELLSGFLNGLAIEGSKKFEDQSRRFAFNENPTLDPIQLLVLLRCGSEEMRATAAKFQKKGANRVLFASIELNRQQNLLPGWAEDAVVVAEQFGQGKLLEKALEAAINTRNFTQQALIELMDNAMKIAGVALMIAKVSGIYMSLTGDVSSPDEPLIRTLDRTSGGTANLIAKFKIDTTSLSNYLKDNRFTFLLLGVDVDSPRSETLKSVETEWKMGPGNSYDSEDIVTFNNMASFRVVTDEKTGIAKVAVLGKGRQVSIAREPVLIPHMKRVRIAVTPQVKATDILQDLVDATATVASGPLGILTFISECIFRMKIFGTEIHQLLVKDWWVVRNTASVSIRVQGRRTQSFPEGMMAEGIDRGIGLTDIFMSDQTLEPPPTIDWNSIPDSPTKRQSRISYDAMLDASKRLLFISEKNGTVSSHVHDYFVSRGKDGGCGGSFRVWNSTVTDGVNSEPFRSDVLSNGTAIGNGSLMVALREDQKKVWIAANVPIKGTTIKSGSDGRRVETPYSGSLLDGIKIDPQFSEHGTLVVPIQNTVSQKEYKLWSGTVPFTHMWRNGEYAGTGIVSYSVIRKLVNKK